MGTAKWAEIAEEIPQVKSIMARRAGEVQEKRKRLEMKMFLQ